MIDAENEIFTAVRNAVVAEIPNIYMVGEYTNTPPQFPCISLVEIDNAVYRNSSTESVEENHVAVTYEVNVYSNKTKGKKSEVKAIAKIIDDTLARIGFTRMMFQPVPNLADTTIYRMIGRYRAVIGRDHTIYRR